jgi:adenylate kinase family enzyme
MRRVNVVGTSSVGKSTLALALAERLGVPYVELDALHWEPNWTEAPDEVMRERVRSAISPETWVVDGNYAAVRDLVWARADTVVWLDLSLPTILGRYARRTMRRIILRQELWAGNRERLGFLFGRDSLLWWILGTYRRRRRDYPLLLAANPHITAIRLRSPRDARAWLASVRRER